MASYDYDLIVIGSGAAGIIAAQQIAKSGKKVAIVENRNFGGSEIILSRIQRSSLLNTAHIFNSAQQGSSFGLRTATIGYNYPAITAWKNTVVSRTGVDKTENSLVAKGINAIRGRGYFIDPHTISIGSARFSAEKFLIATGSEETLPQIEGLSQAGFLTGRESLHLMRPHKKLLIIGSGVEACELAQLFATFGSKVIIITHSTRLLEHEEPEVAELMTATFKDQYGLEITTEATIEKIEKVVAGKKVTIRNKGQNHTTIVDEIIIATEKRATTDIGLENAGVTYHEGAVQTDEFLATSAPHIYAAGSCTGAQNSTHIATYQSQIAAHNILHPRKRLPIDYRVAPRCVFTYPEIAAVGLTEAQAVAQGLDFKYAIVPLSVITKANINDFDNGFVKILCLKKTGAIIGGTVISPMASELIQELTLCVQHGLTVQAVAHTMHTFPSWSEAIRVACAKLAAQIKS